MTQSAQLTIRSMSDLRNHFGISHQTLYRHLKKHFGERFKGKKWLYPGEVEEIMQVFNKVQQNFEDEDNAPLL
jgi:AraC-like DNA-binding protein